MPRVRMSALWEAPIPLPPLSEQHRIVAHVEALFTELAEARRLHEAASEDVGVLLLAVSEEAFARFRGDEQPTSEFKNLSLIVGMACTSSNPQTALRRCLLGGGSGTDSSIETSTRSHDVGTGAAGAGHPGAGVSGRVMSRYVCVGDEMGTPGILWTPTTPTSIVPCW
jgi:hypothetical protein